MLIVMTGILYFQALPLTAYSHAQPLFNLGAGLTRLGKQTKHGRRIWKH